MAGFDGMQKMLPESPPRRRHTLHPLCALNAFSCNKLLLFIYALLFLFVGIVLTAIGVLVEMHRARIESIDNRLAVPTTLLIVVGLIIALNALCGLVGTMMERPGLLKIFLALTIVCFLVQVTIGIIAFIYREELPEMMSDEFMFAIEGYSEDKDLRKAVNWLQDRYECCGFSSFMDYKDVDFGCKRGKQVDCGVPKSCCRKKEGVVLPDDCGFGIHKNATMHELINTEGCTNAFLGWLIEHLDLVGAIALGFAIPQIFGILLSYYFLRKVQEHRIWYRVDHFHT